MQSLIIITARKNSRRIKNKNLIYLGKKKLVEYSLNFALKVSRPGNIFVSTDSFEIKKIAQNYGVICPNLRPKYLSEATSNSADVCIHAINEYEKLTKNLVNYIILLQPTSPFRSINLFNKTKNIFLKNMYPTYSVSKLISRNFIFSEKDETFFLKNKKNFFEINGSLYFISKKDLNHKKSFTEYKNFNISVFKNNKYSIDIDTIYDLEKAKKYL